MNTAEILEQYGKEIQPGVPGGWVEPYPKLTESQWPTMQNYLLERGLSFTTARRNAWYPTSELDGVARVVIPCSNSLGVPFWQARAMYSSNLRYRSAKGSRNQSVCIVWPRGSNTDKGLVVCEGPMDALAAATHGLIGLATLGANFSGYATDWIRTHLWEGKIKVIPDLDCPEFGLKVCGILNKDRIPNTLIMLEGVKDLAGLRRPERRRVLGL